MKKSVIFPILFVLFLPIVFADDFTISITPSGILAGGKGYTFSHQIGNDVASANNVDVVTINRPGGFGSVGCGAAPGTWTLSGSSTSYCNYTDVGGIIPGGSETFAVDVSTGSVTGAYNWKIDANHNSLGTTSKYPATNVDGDNPTIITASILAFTNSSILISGQLIDSNYFPEGTVTIRANVTNMGGSGYGNVSLYWRNDGVLAGLGDNYVNMTDLTGLGNNRLFEANLTSADIVDGDIANFIIFAQDGATNNITASNSGNGYEWTCDGTSPVAIVVTPIPSSVVYNTKPRMEITWTETGSGIDLFTTGMTLNGLPVVLDWNNLTNMYYVPDTSLAQGVYTVQAFGNDSVKNYGDVSWTFTIMEPIITSAIIVSPPTQEAVSGQTILAVQVDGTDNLNVTSVGFYKEGILQGTDTDEPYYYLWDTTSDVDGQSYVWYANVTATTDELISDIINVTVNQSDSYYTKEEVNATIGYYLSNYYNKTEVYTQQQVNDTVKALLIPYMNESQTNLTIDEKLTAYYDIMNINNLLLNYYNRSETNQTIGEFLLPYADRVEMNLTISSWLAPYINESTVNMTIIDFLSFYSNNSKVNQTITEYLLPYINASTVNQTIVSFLSDYANETKMNLTIASWLLPYMNESKTNTTIYEILIPYADEVEMNSTIQWYIANITYNRTEVDAKLSAINGSIDYSNYWNITEIQNRYYNRSEIDALLSAIIANTYLKTEVYNRSETNQTIASWLLPYINASEINTTIQSWLTPYTNGSEVNSTIYSIIAGKNLQNATQVNSSILIKVSDLQLVNQSWVSGLINSSIAPFLNESMINATADQRFALLITNYANLSEMNNTIDVRSVYWIGNLTYSKTDIDALFSAANWTDMSNYWNISEITSRYYNSSDILTNYYDKTYIDLLASTLANRNETYFKNETYNVSEINGFVVALNTTINQIISDVASVNSTVAVHELAISFLASQLATLQSQVTSIINSLTTPKITSITASGTVTSTPKALSVVTDINSQCRYANTSIDFEYMTFNLTTADQLTHTTNIPLKDGLSNNIFYVVCNNLANNKTTQPRTLAFNLDTSSSYNFTQILKYAWNWFYLPRLILEGDGVNTFPIIGNYSVQSVLNSIDGQYTYVAYKNETDWVTYVPNRTINDLNEFNDVLVKPYFMFVNDTLGTTIKI